MPDLDMDNVKKLVDWFFHSVNFLLGFITHKVNLSPQGGQQALCPIHPIYQHGG
jgi:hypothetical protein